MDASKIYEEKLREATCFGDEDAVHALVEKGLNINAQHEINGWTALHWAAKRGHANIVAYLLSHGADKTIHSKKGETPALLTDSEEILRLLGASPSPVKKANCPLPITPGYLKYPSVNYKVDVDSSRSQSLVKQVPLMNGVNENQSRHDDELVLKVRIAQANDPDFIEVELPFYDMSYSRLLRVCCEELGIDLKHVLKIRKLPDTIIRKDKDVRRLQNLQELELVLSTNRVNNGPTAISSPGFRNCTILY